MKKVKQLLSVLAALVLVVGLSFSNVFAVEPSANPDKGDGSITVSNAIEDKTYSIYRILDLESKSADGEAFSYVAAKAWENFFLQTDVNDVLVKIDDQRTQGAGKIYVTFTGTEEKQKENAAKLAALAKDYAVKERINPVASGKPTAKIVEGKTVYSITFENLKNGYYLVDTTTGTICGLTATENNKIALEKNTPPTVDKQVQEDSKVDEKDPNAGWDKKNDADLDQTVNYKTTIKAYPGAENYILHDTMNNLTFDTNSVVVKAGTKVLTLDTDYSVKTTGFAEDHNCTFEVIFTKDYLDSIDAETDIVVTYSATVDSNAAIVDPENVNSTKLTYGENSSHETEPSTTTTYVWKFDILKYNQKDEKLAGAKFVIQNKENKYLQFEEVTVDNQKVYRYTGTTDVEANATKLVSNSDDELFIIGLDADVYTVTETDAPAGYNKLAMPFTVTIKSTLDAEDSTKLTYTVTPTGNDNVSKGDGDTVKVLNTTGSQLPETGGMGTTYLYVIGGLLVAGSTVLMIARKRMSAE